MVKFKSFILLFSLWLCKPSTAQDLQLKMDSLRMKGPFFEFYDKTNDDLYSYGWIEQRYCIPVFRSVVFEEASAMLTIEGIVTEGGRIADTASWGVCPCYILVARPDANHYLHNVRQLGTAHCGQGPSQTKAGFFRIQFRVTKEDILIFGLPGREGAGAIVYKISKLYGKMDEVK